MKLKQRQEITWNIVNCLLSGALVLLGSMSNGNITAQAFLIALVVSGIVALTKFKEFWDGEKSEYSYNMMRLF